MDVTTVFLNGDLYGEIYMKQPEGFASEGQEHLVCKHLWIKASTKMLKHSSGCTSQENGLPVILEYTNPQKKNHF
jgi:hypothetical protein